MSCGVISDADLETLDYEQITKLSQFALSRAKERGKNQLVFFDREDYDTFVANRQMTRNLRKAVSKEYQGFELYFQPIMRVGSEEIFAAKPCFAIVMPREHLFHHTVLLINWRKAV